MKPDPLSALTWRKHGFLFSRMFSEQRLCRSSTSRLQDCRRKKTKLDGPRSLSAASLKQLSFSHGCSTKAQTSQRPEVFFSCWFLGQVYSVYSYEPTPRLQSQFSSKTLKPFRSGQRKTLWKQSVPVALLCFRRLSDRAAESVGGWTSSLSVNTRSTSVRPEAR